MNMKQTPVVFLCGAALAFLAACGSDKSPPPSSAVTPIVVQTVTVGTTSATAPITATGILAAKEEVTLSFKIGGVISDIRVNAGDRIRAGQTLAVLSQAEIGNEVAKARLARDKAARDLARVKALYADSVATLAQLQDATTGLDVAQANVGIAEFNQRYTVVSAPADGEVLERLVERNQLVTPGAAIVRVRTARQGMVLRVGLSDRDAARTRVGDVSTITFDALPEQQLRGVVTQVGVSASARTGTFDVELALRDVPRTIALSSGWIGRATITPRQNSGALAARTTIPIEALVEAAGDTAVIYTVTNGSVARRQQVVVTSLDGDNVVLRDAMANGTQVITSGAAFVVDGSAVQVTAMASDRPARTTGAPRR
jgi:RND family efflux transporter MFP subunit